MGFRDDNEALRARIQTLETEKEQLREEKRRLKSALAGNIESPEESAPSYEARSIGDSLDERISKRAAEEQSNAQRQAHAATAKRAKAIARLQKRHKRVRVETGASHRAINIRPNTLGDQLRQQLGFGFGFALINPGAPIMIGLAFLYASLFDMGFPWLVITPFVTWAVILTLINLAYAKWKSPPYRLELTDEHFALYKRGKEPVLFGELGELEVDAPKANPAELHRVRISDGREEEDIEFLCSDDVNALKSAVRSVKSAVRSGREPEKSERKLRK